VLADDGQRLLRLDGEQLHTQAELGLPASAHALAVAGRQGLACGMDGQLQSVSMDDLSLGPARKLGQGPVRALPSSDGRWWLAWSSPADGLQLLDPTLQTVRHWPLPGPVAWIADARRRRAFVIALAAPAQLWLLSYDERAEDFYEGLVHDYRMGEGVPQRGFHNVRRMPLPAPLLDASFGPEDSELAGRGMVFHLDVRRVIASPAALQPPAPGAAALAAGGTRLVVPVQGAARLAVFGTRDWRHLADIATPWPVARVLAAGDRLLALPAAPDPGRELLPLDAATLQPQPPWPLPGPVLDAVAAPDGRALWLQLGGEAAGIARLDAGDGRITARRALRGVRALSLLVSR
jgi:hypothetical protein